MNDSAYGLWGLVLVDSAFFMGQTKLTLTHDDFEPGSKLVEGISRGWPAILSGLRSVVEGGKV